MLGKRGLIHVSRKLTVDMQPNHLHRGTCKALTNTDATTGRIFMKTDEHWQSSKVNIKAEKDVPEQALRAMFEPGGEHPPRMPFPFSAPILNMGPANDGYIYEMPLQLWLLTPWDYNRRMQFRMPSFPRMRLLAKCSIFCRLKVGPYHLKLSQR